MNLNASLNYTDKDNISVSNDNIPDYHYVKFQNNGKTSYQIFDSNNLILSSVAFDNSDNSIVIKIFHKHLSKDFRLGLIIEKCSSLLMSHYGLDENTKKKSLIDVLDNTLGELKLITDYEIDRFEGFQNGKKEVSFLIGSLQKAAGFEFIDVRIQLSSLNLEESHEGSYIPLRIGKVKNIWEIINIGTLEDLFEDFVLSDLYLEITAKILEKVNKIYPSEKTVSFKDNIPFIEIPHNTTKEQYSLSLKADTKIYYSTRDISIKIGEKGFKSADIFNEYGEIIAEAEQVKSGWIIKTCNCDEDTIDDILVKLNSLRKQKTVNLKSKSIVNEPDIGAQQSLFGLGDLPIRMNPRRGGNQEKVGRNFEEIMADLLGGEIIDRTGNFPDIVVDIPGKGKNFFEVKSVSHGSYFLIKPDQLAAFTTLENIFYTLVMYKDTTPGVIKGKKKPADKKSVELGNLVIEKIIILPARILSSFLSNCIANEILKEKPLSSKGGPEQHKIDLPIRLISDFLVLQEGVRTVGKVTYLSEELSIFDDKFGKI